MAASQYSSAAHSIRFYLRMGIYLCTMALWGIGAAPLSLAFFATGRRFSVGRIATRSFAQFVGWVLGLRLEIEGLEHLKLSAEHSAVIMLNHQSVLDVWLLGFLLPARVSIMVKKSLLYTPIGPFLHLSGAIFVPRGTRAGPTASLRKAATTLANSTSLVVFPEGTRNTSTQPDLLPFKRGGFHLAVQAGMPIIPVVCENYAHMYEYRRRYFEPTRRPLRVRVLPPIPTNGLDDVPALTASVHAQMAETLREMSQPTRNEKYEAVVGM